jgi:hypothetical protein
MTATGLGTALALLRAEAPENVLGLPENRPRWDVPLPHVPADLGEGDAAAWHETRAGAVVAARRGGGR